MAGTLSPRISASSMSTMVQLRFEVGCSPLYMNTSPRKPSIAPSVTMKASTPVFHTISPLIAPSAAPVASASSQATPMAQSPMASMNGQLRLSSITTAASANVAPTDRSMFPLSMTMVMPSAMMPMGADCLSSSSMLSTSMNAVSEVDRKLPTVEKKISSRTMKPQMALCAISWRRVVACMDWPPSGDRRQADGRAWPRCRARRPG